MKASINDWCFIHEYRHTLQGMDYGPTYITAIGIPSFYDLALGDGNEEWSGNTDLTKHDVRSYEMEANSYAAAYFKKYYNVTWDDKINPRNKNDARVDNLSEAMITFLINFLKSSIE